MKNECELQDTLWKDWVVVPRPQDTKCSILGHAAYTNDASTINEWKDGVNEADESGFTPLHYAALAGAASSAAALLQKGANPLKPSAAPSGLPSFTPMDIARTSRHNNIIQLFENWFKKSPPSVQHYPEVSSSEPAKPQAPVEPVVAGARKHIRILSIDGGGIRGVAAVEILKKLSERTGKQITEMFDMIVGTSTGGIIALALAVLRLSPDEVAQLYKELGTKIFSAGEWMQRIHTLCYGCKFSRSTLEKILQSVSKNENLAANLYQPHENRPLAFAAATKFAQGEDPVPLTPFLFRNYEYNKRVVDSGLVYEGTTQCKIWEALCATSAAPVYFPPLRIKDTTLVDGGVLVNNPAAVAFDEARLLWGHDISVTIVSLGTGKSKPQPIDLPQQFEWLYPQMKTLYALITCMIDTAIGHDAVDVELRRRLYGNGQTKYYRYDPKFTIHGVEIGDVDLADAGMIDSIMKHTGEWMDHSEEFDVMCEEFAK